MMAFLTTAFLRMPWRTLALAAGWRLLVAGLLLLGADSVFAQCSLCRDAAAASSPETREAMNYAIIGLALTPYGIASAAAWTLSPALRAWVFARLTRLRRSKSGDSL